MFWTNYHTHTKYCDGTENAEAYLRAAMEQDVRAIGFSSHAPMPVNATWTLTPEDFGDYVAEMGRLRAQYRDKASQHGTEVFVGLEIDYLPGVSWWDTMGNALRQLDYTIGAVHFVDQFADGRFWEISEDQNTFARGLKKIFKGDVKAAVSRYYELLRWMIMLENPDIVAHLDLIKLPNTGNVFFLETDSWYRIEVEKTLKVIANMGSIVEVNTRGLYSGKCLDLYPSQWILEKMLAKGIPVTLSSDAHSPVELTTGFSFAANILQKIGYTHTAVLLDGKWQDIRFSDQGLILDSGGRPSRTA